MNPLGNGSGLTPQVLNAIRQAKGMMSFANGNPMEMLRQMNTPQANQVLQMLQTQNPQQVFNSLAGQMGLDANAIMNELRK